MKWLFATYLMIFLPFQAVCYGSIAPSWLPNEQITTGNKYVINNTQGNTTNAPPVPIPFDKSFDALPKLGYGVKNYRGSDLLVSENFDINLTDLTTTQFKVQVRISGYTNVYRLCVGYIAIDPTYPYHINAFSSVPINYTGPLTDINGGMEKDKTFTDEINYSQQAMNETYNTFSDPLQNNKIVLFLTTIYNQADGEDLIYFEVSNRVINRTHYSLSCFVQKGYKINKLHFSQLIFNADQIAGDYTIVYQERVLSGSADHQINVPAEFINNFFMGLLDFSADSRDCGLQYNWEFEPDQNIVYVNKSIPRDGSSANCGLRSYRVVIFYMKTWNCSDPAYPYFNLTGDMCQDACAYFYYANETTDNCQKCLDYCQQCDNDSSCNNCTQGYVLDQTNSNCVECTLQQCLSCQAIDQCKQCNLSNNYVLNTTSKLCVICPLQQCLECASESQCSSCNNSNNYTLQSGNCVYCNQSLNQFMNGSTCQKCTLMECLDCSSLSSCSQCNQSNNYFLNYTSEQCQKCQIEGCLKCSTLSTCLQCDRSLTYVLNNIFLCQLCSLEGCIQCESISQCKTCNLTAYYVLNSTKGCSQCSIICGCDGYYLDPAGSRQCTSVCGDSMIRVEEECDDGNSNNGDGCSSGCKVEEHFVCENEPSCCGISTEIKGEAIRLNKNQLQNAFQIQITVQPMLEGIMAINVNDPAQFSVNSDLKINFLKSSSISKSITLQYSYQSDIDSLIGQINFLLKPAGCLSSPLPLNVNITLKSDNNVPLLSYSYSDYDTRESMEDVYQAAQIISYVILFLSLLSGKIVGLELFGVLQLAYLSLANNDDVNLILQPLMEMKELNGLNVVLSSEATTLPNRVESIGYDSLFINNCNVMLFLLLAQVLVGIALYLTILLIKVVSPTLHKITRHLLKEILLTLIIFNSLNIAFSVGIHFTYADSTHSLYVISTILAVLSLLIPTAIIIALMFTSGQGFGEFKEKLKPDWACKGYFILTLFYRFALGAYIAANNQQQLSTLLVLSASMAFLLYNLVNLPFTAAYMNYRANICHITQLIILLVTNYYRSMKSTTPLQEKGRLYAPAIVEVVAIYICIGVSGICLCYQMFKWISAKCSAEKLQIKSEEISEVYNNQDTHGNATFQE